MEPYLPWYIAGPLIGLIVPALLFLRQKQFGVSSSFSFILSHFLPKSSYFINAKTKSNWQFHFAVGILLSALASSYFISLEDLVIENVPNEIPYLMGEIYTSDNAFLFLIGGLLIGFGARYADGCTAGNCIMGVSQFSVSSIIATVSFFIAGVLTAQFINPLLF